MSEISREYDSEFMVGAVGIVRETKGSIAEVVRELGIVRTMTVFATRPKSCSDRILANIRGGEDAHELEHNASNGPPPAPPEMASASQNLDSGTASVTGQSLRYQ